jgi:ParB/RepB/Spo0J family partition protein
MKIAPETFVRLSDIAGIDPKNVRRDRPDDDLTGLRASIRAHDLLQRLLLRGAPGAYTVLAGGRRWRALCANAAEDGDDLSLVPVRACIFEGTEAEAIEVSLAENKEREALHPVDEHEAYAHLSQLGFSVERIALDFGTSRGHVRRRLALAALSPKVREAWRRRTIDEDAARAFCAAPSHAAQEQLLEAAEAWALQDAKEIRRRLRGGAVRADDLRALYVGADAYLAAGGVITSSLFEQEQWFADGELLKRLARERMQRKAEAICHAEGWAWARAAGDIKPAPAKAVTPALLEAEAARLAEIDRLDLSIPAGDPRWAELDAEYDEIMTLATLRAVPKAERGKYGIVYQLDPDGRLSVDRGMQLGPPPAEPLPGSAAPAGAPAAEGAAGRTPAGASAKHAIGSPTSAASDAALNKVLAECVGASLPLALACAVAALSANVPSPIRIERGALVRAPTHPRLVALSRAGFAAALAELAGETIEELAALFCDLVRMSLDVRRHLPEDGAAIATAAAARGLLVEQRIAEVFDYTAHFRDAPRDRALAALAEISPGQAVAAKWLKDGPLRDQAVLLARSSHWLPQQLRLEPTPTALQGRARDRGWG